MFEGTKLIHLKIILPEMQVFDVTFVAMHYALYYIYVTVILRTQALLEKS